MAIVTDQFTISVINDGEPGSQGVSVSNVIPEYRLSDSSAELTGDTTLPAYQWNETKPEVPSGKYIWTRNRNELSNGTTVYSDAVCDVVTSGLVFDVDRNTNAITQKVWQTDITTKISEYDNSTAQSIRDDVSQLNIDLGGITTRVGTVESNLTTKADGSTVTTLQNDYSDFKQTMSGFKTTVESNYVQTSDLDDLKVSGNNLYIIKDSVPGYLRASDGTIATQSSTSKEYTSDYIPVIAGKTYIIQSWVTPSTTGSSWLGYQFFSNNTAADHIGTRTSKYGSDAGSGVETTAEGMEHLVYKVTAPENAAYLRVSYRQFENGYCMVEQATMASEYAMSYKDLENYTDGQVSSVRTTAEQAADHISWIIDTAGKTSSTFTFKNRVMELVNADLVIKDPSGNATVISGGNIQANSITTAMLATDAIKSNNYSASVNTAAPYSATGTFLDLANGNFWTPNFGVINTTPTGTTVPTGAWFNGTVNASAGRFGIFDQQNVQDNQYWSIQTVQDYNMENHAALVGIGSPYLQTENWQLNDNALQTMKYTSNGSSSGNVTYFSHTDETTEVTTYYDVGIKVPTLFSSSSETNVNRYLRSFFYSRSAETSIPLIDSDWTYNFMIDNQGVLYVRDIKIIGGGSGYQGDFLPTSGGTISGNLAVTGDLTVNGTLSGTATSANALSTARNIQTNLESTSAAAFDGSSAITPGVTGVLGITNGGTGKSSWTQYGIVYASSSSALGQIGSGTSGQILKSNGSAAPSWINQSSLSVGSASTAASANQVANNLVIKLNSGTTEGTNQFTYNGSAEKNINITKSSIGLSNVDNTADANKTVSHAATAGQLTTDLVIKLNGGTTEGTNMFTYNGSAGKTINVTKSSIGLSNVENTKLSTWAGSSNLTTTSVGTLGAAATHGADTSISAASTSTNLPTSAAVASFVEGKGYVTSSGVTSITLIAGSGISLDTDNTAITSTGTRTITNSGVRSVTEGSTNGTISVNTNGTSNNVAVHGLGSWAYKSSGSGSDVGLGNVLNLTQVTGIGQGDNGTIRVWKGSGANDYEDIEVTITAYAESTVEKAESLDISTDVGSSTLPVYFPGSGSNQGKPVAITSIPWSLISNPPSTYAPSSHTHGNISMDGKIPSTATATIASGDRIAIIDTDTTAGNKITGSSITFGNSTSTVLANNGTWVTPPNTTYTFADGTNGSFDVTPSGGTKQTVSIGTPNYANALVVPAAVGSSTQPVYFNSSGQPVKANKIPKLNNASSDSAFYAPTTTGTSGQILQSSGDGAPTWVNQSTLSVGSATSATTAANVSGSAGSQNAARHVWFSDNTTETARAYDDDFKYNPSTNTLTVANLSGNASTATSAVKDGNNNIIANYYCTLSTDQDNITGAKTFSAVTTFSNTTASTSKSTGAVKISGGLGVAGRTSANEIGVGDHVVLQYNSTTSSLDIIFS